MQFNTRCTMPCELRHSCTKLHNKVSFQCLVSQPPDGNAATSQKQLNYCQCPYFACLGTCAKRTGKSIVQRKENLPMTIAHSWLSYYFLIFFYKNTFPSCSYGIIHLFNNNEKVALFVNCVCLT